MHPRPLCDLAGGNMTQPQQMMLRKSISLSTLNSLEQKSDHDQEDDPHPSDGEDSSPTWILGRGPPVAKKRPRALLVSSLCQSDSEVQSINEDCED